MLLGSVAAPASGGAWFSGHAHVDTRFLLPYSLSANGILRVRG